MPESSEKGGVTRRKVLAGLAGIGVLGFFGNLLIGRHFFSVTNAELQIKSLLAVHDGLKIAHLTDIHVGLGTPAARIRAAVEAVNAASPDLVLVTGDLVTSHINTPLEELILVAGLRSPTFVTLGNHDHWQDADGVQSRLEGFGYTVLRNDHAVIQLRGQSVTLLGVDDGYTGHADVVRTFAGAPEGGTRLVLAHTPPTADDLPPDQGLLCLSGHTHGGQFVVPWVTATIMRSTGQPYWSGLYQVNGNTLYVNRGLGFGRGGPPRFRSDPEVAIFTLRSV